MDKTRVYLLPAGLLALAFATAVAAQDAVPFNLTYTQGAITTSVANGSLLTLSAPLGQSQTLLISAAYTGTRTVTVSQLPFLSGSTAFNVTINQTLPITLTAGQSFVFSVQFTPPSPSAETAKLTVPFAEEPASTNGAITLSLQGVTSAIVVSYVLPSDNNVVPLQAGGVIPFPETLAGSSSSAGLNMTNIGSTLGQVTRISVTGPAFRLQGLPLFPATLPANQNLQVQVLFKPTTTGTSEGTVTVETSGADPVTIRLTGSGVAPRLTYQSGSPSVPVSAGGTIRIPNVAAGQSSTSQILISNSGLGAATISTLAIVGQAFQLTNTPALPQTVAPGGSLALTVTFTPTKTGAYTGTLAVNSDVFNLTGEGLGAGLIYSYVSGGTTITLGTDSNSIVFSPVRVTDSAQVALEIKNTGPVSVPVLNIGIGQTGTAYTLTNPPALPTAIAPNASLKMNIKFEPTVVGFASTTLVVDGTSIPLTGSGTQPPALPAYSLSGPNGTVAPLTQPSVGLKLATPYPTALTGTLTLSPAITQVSDPAVQFATGGRTIAFRIPANSTDAVFAGLGTQAGLQTGTVAGTMTLTPSFATQAGNVDLTPSAPVTSQFTVGAAVPAIVSVQLLTPTATGFTVQVTGYSTTRSLTAMNIQFTTASGFDMPTSQFAVDLKSSAAVWFQSNASQAFGGQFRISVPFTFQLPAAQSVLTGISAVAVTVSNESGNSAALQARIQ